MVMCSECNYLYLSSETTLPSMSLASNSKMECAFLTWSSTSLAAGRISRPIDWSTRNHVNCVSLLSAPTDRTVRGGRERGEGRVGRGGGRRTRGQGKGGGGGGGEGEKGERGGEEGEGSRVEGKGKEDQATFNKHPLPATLRLHYWDIRLATSRTRVPLLPLL